MAVIDKGSNLTADRYDPSALSADPVEIRGRVVKSTGNVTNAASDSSGSSYHLVDLPSDCILEKDTFFKVDNWGFAQVVIGTRTDTTALVNVAKAAGAMVTPVASGDSNHGKRLWETLGMASDPGGNIGIYAHAAANATAAGTMLFEISYLGF